MMRNRFSHSRALTLAAALPLLASPLFAQEEPAAESLAWLESLAVEGRSRLRTDAEAPRLFRELSDDGRTWFETIAADIASGNWTQVDEAILICLAEAEHMKEQAEAVTGTAAETAYHEARKEYLAGAAKLLDAYRLAAGLIVDDVVAPLMALPDLPDLTLPSTIPNTEVRLHEIAGSGQINTNTLAFSGQLNAMIELPGFETTLAVPNLSFDSFGNFDLTAYGSTVFPPNDPGGVRLTIPARRPLDLHFGGDGDWSAAGGLRIRFPDGNTVEGFMDMDDPNYAFGFSFSGALTLELVQELTLLAPSFSVDTSTSAKREQALAAIGGFGRFYRSFGLGLETFLDDSSGLSNPFEIGTGVAPDFKAPEPALPLHVLHAWLVGTGDPFVQPLLSGGSTQREATLEKVKPMLQSLVEANERLRTEITANSPPPGGSLQGDGNPPPPGIQDVEHRQITRLRMIVEIYHEFARNYDVMLNSSPAEAVELYEQLGRPIVLTGILASQMVAEIAPDSDVSLGLAAIKAYLKIYGTIDDLEFNSGVTLDRTGLPPIDEVALVVLLRQLAGQVYDLYGFNPDGTVKDQVRVDALIESEVRALTNFVQEMATTIASFSDAGTNAVELAFLELLVTKRLAIHKREYEIAGQVPEDYLGLSYHALNLLEVGAVIESLGVYDDIAPEDLELTHSAFYATQGTLVQAFNEERAVEYLNQARLQSCEMGLRAARESNRLTGGQPYALDARAVMERDRLQCQGLFEQAALIRPKMSVVNRTALDQALEVFLREVAFQDQERLDEISEIEAKFSEAFDTLEFWADAFSYVSSLNAEEEGSESLPAPPSGAGVQGSPTDLAAEVQATWQAIHAAAVPAAQNRKLHGYLADYMQNLERQTEAYPGFLPETVRDAFITAGTETGQALSDIIGGLTTIVTGLEPFQFELPGDIQIENLFGEVAFNRVIPSWDVAFGGALSFPDIGARFAIPSATIDSSGNFSLSLSAFSDQAFGLNEDFSLGLEIPGTSGTPFTGTLPFFVIGFNPDNTPIFSTPLLNGFSATGTLTQRIEGGADQNYAVTVDYQNLNPGHRFAVETVFGGQQDLFTPEVLLFNGGFGFDLETDGSGNPSQGGAEVGATVGLLIRPEAEAALQAQTRGIADLTPADYFLNFAGNARADFSTVDSTVELTLLSGTMTLPEDIFSGPGDTPPTIALLTPVCVRLNTDDPEQILEWCDPAGNPVRLAINNLGFKIPGIEDAESTSTSTNPTEAPEANAVPGFQAGVSAILLLSGTDFPVIEKIDANIIFPVPGQSPSNPGDTPNLVNLVVSGEDWSIDGFPKSASIALGAPLRLVDLDGLDLDVLAEAGTQIGDCPPGLSFARDPATGEVTIAIASGMQVTIDPNLIAAADASGNPIAGEGATLRASASGCFEWVIGELPTFSLGTIEFSGRFRIGGPEGIQVKGVDNESLAFVRVANLNNFFRRSPSHPFELALEGAINLGEVIEFGLYETKFIWDNQDADVNGNLIARVPSNNLIPRFEPGGFHTALGQETIELGQEILPLLPTKLGLRFKDSSRPIFTADPINSLFDPANLIVIASGQLALPNGAALESGIPGIFGKVDDLEIEFTRAGAPDINGFRFPIPVFTSVNSLYVSLENAKIPPLGGITGGGGIQNINDPENMYFVINAGAEINNAGASVILALSPNEFIGTCFDVNAGAAGIPIDGGFLGGLLLTGAKGGINFKNRFGDPCDFTTYLTNGDFPDESSRPGTPGSFEDDDYPLPDVPTQNDSAPEVSECIAPTQPQFTCIEGAFPPPSINPLCEPVTIMVNGEEQERVVFKGTSLSETTVRNLLSAAGLDPDGLDGLVPSVVIDQFVDRVVGQTQTLVNQVLAGDIDLNPGTGDAQGREFNPDIIDQRARKLFEDKINDFFATLEGAAVSFFDGAFRSAVKADPNSSLYAILVQKGAEGIPCFDVNLKLEGTLSHAAISTVLSGTGSMTMSTTGTTMYEGSLNVMGVPVGTGALAYSLTNANGNIDPSFAGVVEAELGPLYLGGMSMSFGCSGCFDAVIQGLTTWVACNVDTIIQGGGQTGIEVNNFMIAMMDEVAPIYAGELRIPRPQYPTLFDEHFLALNDDEKFAWFSGFLNFFKLYSDNLVKIANGQPIEPYPVTFNLDVDVVVNSFLGCFKGLVVDILTQVNPRICFTGDLGPKLFGFPLTGGADTLLGGGLLYERYTDPVYMVDYQQLVAQLKFSPSYLLLAPVGAVFPLAGSDQANMGLSMRTPAFTEDNVCTLLTDPLKFASDQFGVFVEDSVLSFGYQLQPLGYRLADGQGRVIFPRIGGHPENPNRWRRDPADPTNTLPMPLWVNPDDMMIPDPENPGNDIHDPAIPTRRELILAMLSKGQLQNPLWRGTSQDLAALFVDPTSECYVPGNPGCIEFTEAVGARIRAADPTFTKLGQMDVPNDYFPNGGFIGGAEFALPNLLASTPPAEALADLATLPVDLDDFNDRWLPNALLMFEDPQDTAHPNYDDPAFAYFRDTTCVGQVAMYLPAPGPPAAFFDDGTAEGLFDAIQIDDFQDIIDGTAPTFPADQVMLAGWMDVPIFGLPVAQGLVEFNDGRFLLEAEVFENHVKILSPGDTYFTAGQNVTQEAFDRVNQRVVDEGGIAATGAAGSGSWLHDWVGANLQVEISAPEYLPSAQTFDPENPPEGDVDAKMAGLAGQLASLGEGGVAGFVSDVYQFMPKASASVAAEITIPSEIEQFLTGGVGAEFFAFSPYFDPEFGLSPTGEVEDESPYAVSKRRGGFGIKGNFQLGFFPPGGDPLVIDIPDASFSLFPDANLGVFPSMAAQLQVSDIQLASFFPRFTDGLVAFNSSPAVGERYVELEGHLEPFNFELLNRPLLSFDALNPGGTIGGRFRVENSGGATPGVELEIDPLSANMDFLGPGVAITMFGNPAPGPGGSPPTPGSYRPFTFTTQSGEAWSATVCLSAPGDPSLPPTFAICDPYDLSQDPACAMTFTPNAPLCGTITGVGLDSFTMEVDIPLGFAATFFPGSETETTIPQIGGTGTAKLYVDSEGRFYVDFGQQDDIGLPGVVAASGRLEFGNNPTGSEANVAVSTPTGFGNVEIGSTAVRTVTIQNAGLARANAVIRAEPRDEFTLNETGFSLAPGESRQVDVLFTPSSPGGRNGTLVVESNTPVPAGPVVTRSLSGTGFAVPKYFQSRDDIAFGDTIVGGVASGSVTIGNAGSAALVINSVSKSGSEFILSDSSGFTLQPGESKLLTVDFTPSSLGARSGSLTVATASLGNKTVTLSGNGSESRWKTILEGDTVGNDAVLIDIRMFDGSNGYAMGGNGSLLQTKNGGRSWIARQLSNYTLTKMDAVNVLADYSFDNDTPANSFPDSGPNGYDGTAPVNWPVISFASGNPNLPSKPLFNGRGALVGSSSYVELEDFDLGKEWTISFWGRVASLGGRRAFFGKHDASGNNELVFYIEETGGTNEYRMAAPGAQLTFPNLSAFPGSWGYYVLDGYYDSVTNRTLVTLHVNEINAGTVAFNGNIGEFSNNGRKWVVGMDWDGNTVSDGLSGRINELRFFSRSHDYNRLTLTGRDGVGYQSFNGGTSWREVPNLAVSGVGYSSQDYADTNWNDAAIQADGTLLLGGFENNYRRLLKIAGVDQEYWIDPSFPDPWGDSNGAWIMGVEYVGGRPFAVDVRGRFYEEVNGAWGQMGSYDHNGSLRGMLRVGAKDAIAYGQSGQIARFTNFGNPVTESSSSLINEVLFGAAFSGDPDNVNVVPDLMVVGNGAAHLESTNQGDSWTKKDEGLEGDNRGVAIHKISDTSYEAWVVGEAHRIQYRAPSSAPAPFLTFYPGQLDFGFVNPGESRTLPVEFRNRGALDLNVNNLSISGSAFSLVQGSLNQVAAGDAAVLAIRFKPTGPGTYTGTLNIQSGGETYQLELEGAANGQNWLPVSPIAGIGSVVDLVFTSDTTGYGILKDDFGDQLIKTTDGGGSWFSLWLGAPGSGNKWRLNGIDFVRQGSTNIGYVAGHIETSGGSVSGGRVMRLTNGGSSVSNVTPSQIPSGISVSDVSVYPDNEDVVAVITSDPGGNADVYMSDDSGSSWTSPGPPTSGFKGGGRIVLHPNEGSANGWLDGQLWASSDSAIYWKTSGLNFPFFLLTEFHPDRVVRDFHGDYDINANAVPSYAWMVGDGGLLWRRDPTASGSLFQPAPDAEVFGTTDLTGVHFSPNYLDGWIVGESKIFNSTDGGDSWRVEFDAGSSAQLDAVFSRSPTKAWVGGALDGKPVVWRYLPGGAVTPPAVDVLDYQVIGETSPGGLIQASVLVENNGTGALDLHNVGIESAEPISRFRLNGAVPASVPAGGSVNIPIAFEALPEEIDVEALDPLVFLRFEDGLDATSYRDHTHKGGFGAAPVTPSRQPMVSVAPATGKRDRFLRADSNDYADVSGADDIPDNFSISLWLNPDSTADSQFFFGKHGNGGATNLILGGFNQGGYYFRLRGDTHAGGTKQTGWQHLCFVGEESDGSTQVSCYRDGELLWSELMTEVVGDVSGEPWILAGERDSGGSVDQHCPGGYDDFAIFDRVLSEAEIQALAAKSPVCGEHRAQLVLSTNSSNGQRKVDLRARVTETSQLVVIDTLPSGFPVTVDGVNYTTPVSFAVRCNATNEREWAEGSVHEVTVATNQTVVAAADNHLNYAFTGWGESNQTTVQVVADPTLSTLTATYVMTDVVDTNPPPPAPPLVLAAPPPEAVPPPGFDFIAAFQGTPKGPFIRLTDGNITLGDLEAGGFAMDGEFFASLTRVYGSLKTTGLQIPHGAPANERVFEMGPSNWLVDLEPGSLIFKTEPPSVKLLGADVAPESAFCLEADTATAKYKAVMQLKRDFRLVPNFVEFKKGGVSFEITNPLQLVPDIAFRMEGGLRLWKLPSQFPASPLDVGGSAGKWAVDVNTDFEVDTGNFNLSLADLLNSGNPITFVDANPWMLAGDIRLRRTGGGAVYMDADLSQFEFDGNPIASLTGTISTGTELNLTGTVTSNATVPLLDGNSFRLRNASGGDLSFSLKTRTLPSPRLQLRLPRMKLTSTVQGFPAAGITVPAVNLDTSGDFNTGRIPLPSGAPFSFDGINLPKPSDGELADNFIQLRRVDGEVIFRTKAELYPAPGCQPHDFDLRIDGGGVDASLDGNFCVLPEEVSLGFNLGQPYQFSGSFFGINVQFGTAGFDVSFF